MADITIITPVLNGIQYLEECIQSVVTQDVEVEYIVLDGGSTDASVQFLKEQPGITKLVTDKDDGIYHAINKGIGLATSEVIGILNADDYYRHGALKKVLEIFETQEDAEIVYADMMRCRKIMGKDRFAYGKPDLKRIEETMSIFHPATFVRKSVYDKLAGYDTKYSISADYEFMYRAFKKGVHFEYMPFATTVFRLGGITSQGCVSYEEGMDILKRYNSPYVHEMKKRLEKCRKRQKYRRPVLNVLKKQPFKWAHELWLMRKWR